MKGIECAFVATLSREPELRNSANGRLWLSLGAFCESGGDSQYIQIGYFSHPEEVAEQLHKGDAIYCEGKVKIRSWDAGGERKSCLSVSASLIQPLGLIGHKRPKKAKAKAQPNPKTEPICQLPLAEPAATRGKPHVRPFDDPISDLF